MPTASTNAAPRCEICDSAECKRDLRAEQPPPRGVMTKPDETVNVDGWRIVKMNDGTPLATTHGASVYVNTVGDLSVQSNGPDMGDVSIPLPVVRHLLDADRGERGERKPCGAWREEDRLGSLPGWWTLRVAGFEFHASATCWYAAGGSDLEPAASLDAAMLAAQRAARRLLRESLAVLEGGE